MLTKINNLKELRIEKARLKNELAQTSLRITEDVENLKHTLDPLKLAGNFMENLLINKHGGMLNDSIRSVVGSVSYNTLLSFLPWPLKVGVSYALKNAASNYIYNHKDSIFDKAVHLVSNLKNVLKNNKTPAKAISNGSSNF